MSIIATVKRPLFIAVYEPQHILCALYCIFILHFLKQIHYDRVWRPISRLAISPVCPAMLANLLNVKNTWHCSVATSIACKITFVNDQWLWKCSVAIVNLSNILFYHHLMMTVVMTMTVMLTLMVACCHANAANAVSYPIVTCRHLFRKKKLVR